MTDDDAEIYREDDMPEELRGVTIRVRMGAQLPRATPRERHETIGGRDAWEAEQERRVAAYAEQVERGEILFEPPGPTGENP